MAVLEAYNTIASCLDRGKHTAGIFLDLSKAFDTISHDILLSKLNHYGVRGNALEWFRSYLTNRKQFVSYNNCKSDVDTVLCGVPQGSVLGPLLFILFINDIAFSSNSLSFIIYADDTNVIMSNSNLDHLIASINTEMSKISLWFKVNKLSLNVDKTNYVIFKNRHSNRLYNDIHIFIDGIEIKNVPCTKFLGVYVDECLTWQSHNTYVTNIIWADSNNCNLNKILVKQKRIVRLCTNSAWLAHSPPLFSQLNTLTIYDIHKLIKSLFMYKYVINDLPPNFSNYFVKNASIHGYVTRSSNMFIPAAFRYELARNTILTKGSFNLSINAF